MMHISVPVQSTIPHFGVILIATAIETSAPGVTRAKHILPHAIGIWRRVTDPHRRGR